MVYSERTRICKVVITAIWEHSLAILPAGTAEVEWMQPSLRSSLPTSNPGRTSWASFSRPFGTGCRGLLRSPARFFIGSVSGFPFRLQRGQGFSERRMRCVETFRLNRKSGGPSFSAAPTALAQSSGWIAVGAVPNRSPPRSRLYSYARASMGSLRAAFRAG